MENKGRSRECLGWKSHRLQLSAHSRTVYAGAFAGGFQRDRYPSCRTSAEACAVQELKGSVFTWMPSFPWRKSTSIHCLEKYFPKFTSGRSDGSKLAVAHTHPKFTHTTFTQAYHNPQLPLMWVFSLHLGILICLMKWATGNNHVCIFPFLSVLNFRLLWELDYWNCGWECQVSRSPQY